MAPAMLPTVELCFDKAQGSFANHRKCIESLGVLRSTSPHDFDAEFFACITCILPIGKREPAIERLVEFVVQCTTTLGAESDADNDFVQTLVLRLLEFTDSKDKAVRFRATQLVGRVFNSMKEDAEISDELFEAVFSKMVERCRDKIPSVRAFGARALFRLQDPTSAHDQITLELLRLMSEDASKEVRMAATSTVAPSKHAIAAIVDRTRDVSADVRVHALRILRDKVARIFEHEKVEMRWLSISQRAYVLGTSLVDRDERVVSSARELLISVWLRKCSDNDALKLFKALDVVAHEAEAQLALDVLLSEKDTRELISAASIQWQVSGPNQLEAVFCLRSLLNALSLNAAHGGAAAADELEQLAPELPEYCKALQKAVAMREDVARSPTVVQASFTLAQMLAAGSKLDMANEHGRYQLEQILSRQIKSMSTPVDLLAPLFSTLRAAHAGDLESFQRLVMELISEIEEPLETEEADFAIGTRRRRTEADLRLQHEQSVMLNQAKLGELVGEIKLAVEEEDFEKAAALKKEAAILKDALKTMLGGNGDNVDSALRMGRCLRLCALMLGSCDVKLAEHELSELTARFLPSIQSPSPEHRALAIKCLGLTCASSVKHAKQFFPLFVTSVRHDQEDVQIAALCAIFDLLLIHSPSSFFTRADSTVAAISGALLAPREDVHARELAGLLLPILSQSSATLQRLAACGLCKLMHTDAVQSTSLYARLLLIYFQADSVCMGEERLALKQILAVFFMAGSRAKDLCEALMPAFRTALAAAPGSPDAGVRIDSMLNFVIAISKPDAHDSSASRTLHQELALVFLFEAAHAPEEAEGKILPKCLLQLDLDSVPRAQLEVMVWLLRKIEAGVIDKAAVKSLGKALAHVEGLLHATASPAGISADASKHVEQMALDGLDAQRLLRESDEDVANARRAERARAMEDAEAEVRLTPKKEKRKLARSKATPGHLGHVCENSPYNVM